GGTLLYQTGPGGVGTTTPGKGGPVRFELGKEGGSETVYGTFTIQRRGSGIVLLQISGEGLTNIKKGLTVEEATKLEGTAEVKETLKVVGTTTLAALEGTSAVFSTTLKVKEAVTFE